MAEGSRGDKKGPWFVRQRGVVRMVFHYVTGNLVQFTITYYVTTTATNPTSLTGGGERKDDYNVAVHECCTFHYALVLRRQRAPTIEAYSSSSSSSSTALKQCRERTNRRRGFFLDLFALVCRHESNGQASFPSIPLAKSRQRSSPLQLSNVHETTRVNPTAEQILKLWLLRTDFPYVTGNLGQFTITHYATKDHEAPGVKYTFVDS